MVSIRSVLLALLAGGVAVAPTASGDPGSVLQRLFGANPWLVAEQDLASRYANQQIFAWICSTTIAIGPDAGACAWNQLGGSAPPLPPAIPAILGRDPDPRSHQLLRVVSAHLKPSLPVLEAIPLAPLNRDPGPGATPHTQLVSGELLTQVNALRLLLGRALLPAGPPLHGLPTGVVTSTCTRQQRGRSVGRVFPDFFGTANNEALVRIFLPGLRPSLPGICPHLAQDLLTPDVALTSFQQALLGCGPFFGTRCDGVRIDPLGKRDGIDFPNADATALAQAWPGRPLFSWTTLDAQRQPGTAEVVDLSVRYEQSRVLGPSCSRPDAQGGSTTLPGCRGIENIFVSRDPTSQQVVSVQIAFEDGYRPSVDGCLVGGSVAAEAPLQVIGRLGADIDTGAGGVDVVLVANRRGYLPDATEVRQCHTGGSQTPIAGSSWLWHPVAGCLDEERAQQVERFGDGNVDPGDGSARFGDCGTILVNGTPTSRSFVDRFQDFNRDGILDIEQEFLGTLLRADCDLAGGRCVSAQLFQNELAALSWNLLQLLVTTSCSEDERGAQEIRDDPRCFDPAQPLRADRCSFNTPQLCLNLLEGAPIPVEIRIASPAPLAWAWGTLAVAVLGSRSVDVGAIDPASLGLGGPRAAAPLGRRPEYRDVNGDGRLDLVARFQSWGMRRSDAPVCLRGEIAGLPFEGCAAIESERRDWRGYTDSDSP